MLCHVPHSEKKHEKQMLIAAYDQLHKCDLSVS